MFHPLRNIQTNGGLLGSAPITQEGFIIHLMSGRMHKTRRDHVKYQDNTHNKHTLKSATPEPEMSLNAVRMY